ncbi:hypothetical protein D9757_001452 [Collybiopsis confluens]|uniref:Uncharacterized protein n=1 Tax=Collybiopsis confluens TaxID=2823264 RepID=A0A8H5MFU5_9AGAR|nr:hypothetical protein D9757_001452 [Collybiopsis confluens]
MTSKLITSHRFTFPPFPAPPEGVSIIPYRDFKDLGLKKQNDDETGPEVDGLGIQTVALKAHEDDFCKTRNIQRVESATPEIDAARASRTWVEVWEDLSKRPSGQRYNPGSHRTDRFHEATSQFNKSRTWPPRDKHVREMWDQFQIFIGILNVPPVWRPVQEQKELNNEDDDDDFEDNPTENSSVELPRDNNQKISLRTEDGERSQNTKKRRIPRPPYHLYDKIPAEIESSDDIPELYRGTHEERADQAIEFLGNPERSIRIFLSSYMRKQGFHFLERNLKLLPLLVRFYVKFLLTEGVFKTEQEDIEVSLRKALLVLDLADIELPLTSQITKRLPYNDLFSSGCESLFGISAQEQEFFNQIWHENHPDMSTATGLSSTHAEVSSTAAATRASTPVQEGQVPLEVDIDAAGLENDSETLETPVQGEPTDAEKLFKETAFDEGISLDDRPLSTGVETAAWGSLGDDETPGWGSAEFDTVSDDPWASSGGDEWLFDEKTLFPVLGATALPFTHTSGVVECSMRRIQSIIPPDDSAFYADDGRSVGSGPSAKAVEADLSSRLSKVVLKPWLDWEIGEEKDGKVLPQIKGFSRGRVVVYTQDDGEALIEYEDGADIKSNAAAAPEDGANSVPPAHDPLNHQITILVDPDTAKLLKVGMGLNGKWVQLARMTDLKSGDAGIAESGIQPKEESGGDGQRFWYLYKMLMVLPSYHANA